MAYDRQEAKEDFFQTKSAVLFNPRPDVYQPSGGRDDPWSLTFDRLQVVSLLTSFNSKAVNGVQLCLYRSVHIRICCQSELQTLGTTRKFQATVSQVYPWLHGQTPGLLVSSHFSVSTATISILMIFSSFYFIYIHIYMCMYVCICIHTYI